MENITNPTQATEYLISHSYKRVNPINDGRIGFRSNTGDSSWETRVGPENNWTREENGQCCFERRDKALSKGVKPNYCNDCGIAIPPLESWKQDKGTSGSIQELEKGLQNKE